MSAQAQTSPAPSTRTHKIPPFTLRTRAGTDIWRKPPTHDVFDAPFHPSPLPPFPLKAFQRARITFVLPPTETLRKFDQAGLLLVLTKPGQKSKWLKTGIEYYQSTPYLSTVCTDRYSDWSIVPLPPSTPSSTSNPLSTSSSNPPSTSVSSRPSATIEVQRDGGPTGKTLWVYHIVRDSRGEEIERRPLREVAWFFADAEDEWEVGVGGAVARPTAEGGEGELEAEFGEGVEVEVLVG
ncbi:hypothetical protein K491DRAFT_695387 [Lophiostoma macrostomum CBS 122681]|uniref:Uncharacterized protein n=1 Tax=Lophiostoma macrostomum CBS 122681 TaxID=1314788 RepID=A0A6A6T1C6_9PLEO|nr:hypothetical protein K491DRAFT_695387 [Lophiostoma macrostomum CBS 122681]